MSLGSWVITVLLGFWLTMLIKAVIDEALIPTYQREIMPIMTGSKVPLDLGDVAFSLQKRRKFIHGGALESALVRLEQRGVLVGTIQGKWSLVFTG